MERTERIAWIRPPEQEPPEHIVELKLTEEEVGDLQRALAIYRANSLAVARERPLNNNELHQSATVGKVGRQIAKWQPSSRRPKKV